MHKVLMNLKETANEQIFIQQMSTCKEWRVLRVENGYKMLDVSLLSGVQLNLVNVVFFISQIAFDLF